MKHFTAHTFWSLSNAPPLQTWSIWSKNTFSIFNIIDVNQAILKVISIHKLCVMFPWGVSNHTLYSVRQLSLFNFFFRIIFKILTYCFNRCQSCFVVTHVNVRHSLTYSSVSFGDKKCLTLWMYIQPNPSSCEMTQYTQRFQASGSTLSWQSPVHWARPQTHFIIPWYWIRWCGNYSCRWDLCHRT